MSVSRTLGLALWATLAASTAAPVPGAPGVGPEALAAQVLPDLEGQVEAAERGFARSMAERDADAFAGYVAEDAVFFGASVLRGREAVVAGWAPYFEGAAAPFSWEPEEVVVLSSGALAHSSGPVRDPEGNRVATYNSIWRLDPDGRWRVVFDKGCACPGPG